MISRQVFQRWFCAAIMTGSMFTASIHGLTEEKLMDTIETTEKFLGDAKVITIEDSKALEAKLESLKGQVEEMHALQNQIRTKEEEVDRLVSVLNAKILKTFTKRLIDTIEKEMMLRSLQRSGAAAELVDGVDYVTMRELKKHFVAGDLLESSEKKLQNWVVSLINEELETFAAGVKLPDETPLTEVQETGSQECPSALEVVQNIQVSLTRYSQDGIGLIDHLQGAKIVHSMTSETYVPPPSESDLLGNVWWRRFIPEDWESIMPHGWQEWDIRLPSYLQHTLKISGANVAPPETILEPKVTAGSCWPMTGSQGYVTMRLPYHIHVDTFTIDHVPWQIIPEAMLESAPKVMKVIAYPPCEENDNCGALGFDFDDPMEIGQITFDADGPSVQTFDSIFVETTSVDEEKNKNDSFSTASDGGESCSQEAAACSTPPRIDVAAITLKVLENHGNPDFTCIYRFRVHGEQVL